MNYKLNIILFLIIFIIQVNYDYILHKCQNSYGKNLIVIQYGAGRLLVENEIDQNL